MKMPVKEAETKDKAKNKARNKSIKAPKSKEVAEAPGSQPVAYYLKHKINEKLIKGLVNNSRFNNSRPKPKVGKKKDKEYKILPRGPAYDVILKNKVDEHVYPVDFVVLDIKENEKRPFILGTPFLTTAKALIKFDTGTITLRSGKSKVIFDEKKLKSS
ncbi:reverse transcriptase domain-containing protein [Tanacetum coccineum]|uniref:Reverse transcriptase domain-containing protein n=1 Tax=Tanacetum coccineum TaxID=301880 RepID=A0ABQ5GFY1_9ASTR